MIRLHKTINDPSDQFPIVVNEYPQINTDVWGITSVTSSDGAVTATDIDGSTFTLIPKDIKNFSTLVSIFMHNDTAVTKKDRDYTLNFALDVSCNYYLGFTATNTSSSTQCVEIVSGHDIYYYVGNAWITPLRSSFTEADRLGSVIVDVPAGKKITMFSEKQKIVDGGCYLIFDKLGYEKWSFGGNIMGMLLNNRFEVDNALGYLFSNTDTITVAPELPETNLRKGCYRYMFNECSKLTTPPSLPATYVPELAYEYMFKDCVALATVPVISAKSVGINGMLGMFYNCDSLVNSPDLSGVETISPHAFDSMFENCGNLVHAFDVSTCITEIPNHVFYETFRGCGKLTDTPDLSNITKVGDNSFDGTFYNCTSLTTPPDLSHVVDASSYSFRYMFRKCTSLTTPPDLSGIVNAPMFVFMYMLAGCTSLATAPDLTGIKTVNLGSCAGMFAGCTSLTNFRGLPDSSVASACAYEYMFDGCSSLTTTPDMSHITSADSSAMEGMFRNCTGLTTPPDLSNITVAGGAAFESMFQGCTSLTTPPDISNAELILDIKYPSLKSMFEGCISLTSTPVLSEVSLAPNFERMFYGCTSLVDASILSTITDVNTHSSFKSMFEGCTSLVNPPDMSGITEFSRAASNTVKECFAYMFSGCTSLTSIPDMRTIKPIEGHTGDEKNLFTRMFQNCTSLTCVDTLPILGIGDLPSTITNTSDGWFNYMFSGCSNLNEVHNPMYTTPRLNNSKNLFYNWLDGVSPTGTYYYNVTLLGMSYYTGTQAEKEEQIKADYNVPSEWTMVPEAFNYDDTLEFAPGYPAIIDGSLGIIDVGLFVGEGWYEYEQYIPCPREVTVTCKDSNNNIVFNNTYTITGHYTSNPYIVRINPIVDVNETKVTVTAVATFGSKQTEPITYEIQRNPEEMFKWASGYPEPINNNLSSVNLGYYIGDGYDGDRILKIKFTDPHGEVMYVDNNIYIYGSYTETPYINNIRPNIFADTNELIIDSSVTFMKDGVPVSSILSPKTVTVPAPTFDYTVTQGTDHGKYTGRRNGYTSTTVTVHVNLNIAEGCSTGNRKLVVKVISTNSPGTVILSRIFDNITGNVFEQDIVQSITNSNNMFDVNIVSTVSYYGTYGNLLDSEETTVNSQLVMP